MGRPAAGDATTSRGQRPRAASEIATSVRLAAAQIDVSLGEPERNLERVVATIEAATRDGVGLVVFPECSLSGYVFAHRTEIEPLAETVPGPSTDTLVSACRASGVFVVVGVLERDGDALFNSAVMLDGTGVLGVYRKTHLLCLGLDRLVSPGDALPTFVTPRGRFGMLICYDQRFPEPARVLSLAGAQAILNPANLPEGAEAYAAFFNRARACENRVFVVSANRVGTERGVHFLGRSQVIDPRGRVLAEAGGESGLIVADVDLHEADTKHVVNVPGEYEFDVTGDRRPGLYGSLCGGGEALRRPA